MGILPSAPDVQVFAPTTWFVGQTAVIEIEVHAKEETKVDFIDVRGTGQQGWAVGAGEHRVVQKASFPELMARVMEAGVLPAGRSRYAARFQLPHGCAPSHDLDPARFEIFVHVSIPWWIDGRYRFHVPVRVPPPARVERTPYAVRSTQASTPAGKPRLELSLASTRLIAGETLVGSCAVFHVDDRKPRELDITLVPTLELHRGSRQRDRRAATYDISIPLPAGSAGTNVPFQFRLPEAMSWRGRFTPGDLSVEGTLDHAPIELGLQWDNGGKPARIRASVGSPNEASEQARRVSLALARPAADALGASTPEVLVDKLTRWPAAFHDLHVQDGVVSASLAPAEPPMIEAAACASSSRPCARCSRRSTRARARIDDQPQRL